MATELIKYKYTVDGQEAEGTLGKLEGSFSSLGKVIAGIGAGAVGLGAVGFKAAEMASDLDEAKNVVTQALGEMSDEVIAWSESSISSMGISQTQALKTAGVYANLGTGLGMTAEDAAGMATELTQLSADMSSYFNVSQDVAANALKGIFTGEGEALKEYGVILNDTTLAEAGYSDSMSEAEKIQTRYNVVMEQTKNAQGDFARTSDGLANQTRILNESFKALVTEIGKKLIPVVTNIVRHLNDGLAVAIAMVSGDTSDLTKDQQKLKEQFDEIIPKIVTLAEVIGVLAIAYGAYLTIMAISQGVITLATTAQTLWAIATGETAIATLALDAALLPFITVVLAVIAVIALVVYAALNWADITAYVQEKWTALKEFIVEWATSVYNTFVTWAKSVLNVFESWGTAAVETIKASVNMWKEIFNAGLTFIKNQVQLVFSTILNTIKKDMQLALTTVRNIWNNIKLVFSSVLGLINGIVTGDMGLIKSSIQGIMQGIQGIFSSIWGLIKGIFSNTLEAIKTIVQGTLNNIKGLVSSIMNSIKSAFTTALDSIKSAFSTTFDFIYDNTVGRLNDLLDSVSNIIGNIGDTVSSGLSKINPFDGVTPQLAAVYNGEGIPAGMSGGNQTHINYNIYSSAPQMTLKEMHKQAVAAEHRGGK